ncbi:hypothetical protein B2J93_9054 [Marssonina coronariae]|uniref:Uncharacterized protein n=1 Tax=Diplocarpon coronariae TaxID=2795749 RepID=A0A218Z5A8_9HELO|nr:hypothetical protein B2J93_9054 [Marssonina coronariae]
MPPQTRHQAELPTGQPLHQPITNDRRQRQRDDGRSIYVHPFSLGMQIVYDSDDSTDGDVSSLDLDREHDPDEAEDTDEDENENDSIIVIGDGNDADSEDSEPAAEIRLEVDDDDTISDLSLVEREIPCPIQRQASSTFNARNDPSSLPSPSPASQPASAAATAFNQAPSHFERVYRGRTIIWSHVDWARHGPAVLARESRQRENEKRWRREGGKSRAARKQAWRRRSGGRDRDERGRFV